MLFLPKVLSGLVWLAKCRGSSKDLCPATEWSHKMEKTHIMQESSNRGLSTKYLITGTKNYYVKPLDLLLLLQLALWWGMVRLKG